MVGYHLWRSVSVVILSDTRWKLYSNTLRHGWRLKLLYYGLQYTITKSWNNRRTSPVEERSRTLFHRWCPTVISRLDHTWSTLSSVNKINVLSLSKVLTQKMSQQNDHTHNNNSCVCDQFVTSCGKGLISVLKLISISTIAQYHIISIIMVRKPRNNAQTSPKKEGTFYIAFSFKAGNYTESILLYRWCPVVISRLD